MNALARLCDTYPVTRQLFPAKGSRFALDIARLVIARRQVCSAALFEMGGSWISARTSADWRQITYLATGKLDLLFL